MKKVILASLALVAVASLSSCGAKKSAYRKAYEQAKQREVATQATKPAVQYEAPAVSERATAPVTVRKERVTTYQGEDATRLKRFSVVVGSFQNPTNARNLKERMVKAGYNAVLATNEVGMLRVIVSSFDSREEAAASRDAIKARFAPDFKDAWLLENAN
jgi:hypothetical protein